MRGLRLFGRSKIFSLQRRHFRSIRWRSAFSCIIFMPAEQRSFPRYAARSFTSHSSFRRATRLRRNKSPCAMKVFDAKHIKNIALLGSHGCGKTTLAETMLFEAGLITRRGRVEDRNTVSDHHPLEHERGSSVYSTCLHTEWRNYKINIIDTPGLDDLVGE